MPARCRISGFRAFSILGPFAALKENGYVSSWKTLQCQGYFGQKMPTNYRAAWVTACQGEYYPGMWFGYNGPTAAAESRTSWNHTASSRVAHWGCRRERAGQRCAAIICSGTDIRHISAGATA